MESTIITSLITFFGIIAAAVISYLVSRSQQSANVARTQSETRIAEGAAEVASEKQAVETRLLGIEASQAEFAFHQNLITDLQNRIKEKDAERATEQATLRAQVDEIRQVQADAKSLHDSHITELLTNIDGLIVSLGDADAKIVVLQGQIDELQLKVEGSNTIISGMQEEMLKDKEVIAGLRLEIQGLLVQSVEKAEATTDALTKASE